jgi:Flp pilus assembly protein TadD/predicted Zn-dependent protease
MRRSVLRISAICLLFSALLAAGERLAAQPSEPGSRAADLCNESIPLVRSGQFEAAESRLAEAVRLDPDNVAVLCNYGLLLSKLGRLPEARRQLERGVALDGKSEAALLNLGLICEAMADLSTARTCFLKFIDLSADAGLREKMKDHVVVIDRMLAAGAQNADGTDYFAGAERKQMNPWPADLMPIKIYVAAGEPVPGYKASYGEDLELAIQYWAKALSGKVSFARTDKQSEAGIEVRWANDLKTAVMKAEGGDCKYVANAAGMKHAEITLLTAEPSVSEKLTDAKVLWVALHEFGHALGLAAHSNNPGDVMYFAVPLARSMPVLSERDIATFKRLYTEKLADTWLTLNAEAVKLMKEGQQAQALARLEQALRLKPDEETVRGNIVLVEEALASKLLKAARYAEAEPHLRRALDLEKELKDENCLDVLSAYAELLRSTGRAAEVKSLYKSFGRRPPRL